MTACKSAARFGMAMHPQGRMPKSSYNNGVNYGSNHPVEARAIKALQAIKTQDANARLVPVIPADASDQIDLYVADGNHAIIDQAATQAADKQEKIATALGKGVGYKATGLDATSKSLRQKADEALQGVRRFLAANPFDERYGAKLEGNDVK